MVNMLIADRDVLKLKKLINKVVTKNKNIRIEKIAMNEKETIDILNNENIDVALVDLNIIRNNRDTIFDMIKIEKQDKYRDSIILTTRNLKEVQKYIGNKMIFDYSAKDDDNNEILYKINRMIISKDLEIKRKSIINELRYIGYNIEHIKVAYNIKIDEIDINRY